MDHAAASVDFVNYEDEDWELRHDEDGFTYKILKRQRLLDPEIPVSDPKVEEKRRKQRRKKILLKLKARYQNEIHHWELLSNTLRSMESKANQRLESQKGRQDLGQTLSSSSFILESNSMAVDRNDDASESLIDELVLQAEAQAAVINDMSYLCDVAESICNAQEERLAQSYIDLPVWSSPRKLMQSLGDE